MVTETWLSSSILQLNFPAEYTVYRKDRADNNGGVLLAHKRSYKSHQLSLDSDHEIIACQIELSDVPLLH